MKEANSVFKIQRIIETEKNHTFTLAKLVAKEKI